MTTWKITDLERQIEDGLVVKAHWMISESDGDIYEFAVGVTVLSRGESFVPYEGLTEETVINWLKNIEECTAIEVNVIAAVAAKKTPITTIGVPW